MGNVKFKRLIALYIDFIFIVIFTTLIIQIITLVKIDAFSSPIIICIAIFSALILAFILTSRKDLLFKNASIGKKIMGIAIYTEDGNIPIKNILIKRISSHLLFFPMEIINILLNNKTSGDEEYKTIVSIKKS